MNILITGASGMVGRNLQSVLAKYNLLTPSSRDLDLLDLKQVRSYLIKKDIDLVIHCAGLVGGIQANIKNPVNFLVNNFEMGKNIIISSKECGIKKLINLGSSCMYPKDYKSPLKEQYILEAPLEPTNEGYALAKISVAKLCDYIRVEDSSYQYKTLIPCNLYGSFDKFSPENSHMIPAVIRKIHEAKVEKKESVEIWGDGTARREFMLASDLANFIEFSLDKIESLPNLLNIGIGHDYSILEYYQTIAEVIGYEGDFSFDTSKPVGMKQKLVDISRLKEMGWKEQTSLKEGIQKTYKYFLENEV